MQREKGATASEDDLSVYCLRPFLLQIEVLELEKDRKWMLLRPAKIKADSTAAEKSLRFNEVPQPSEDTPEEFQEISPHEAVEIASSHLNVEDFLESYLQKLK